MAKKDYMFIGWWECDQGFAGMSPCMSTRSSGSVFDSSLLKVILLDITTPYNKNWCVCVLRYFNTNFRHPNISFVNISVCISSIVILQVWSEDPGETWHLKSIQSAWELLLFPTTYLHKVEFSSYMSTKVTTTISQWWSK